MASVRSRKQLVSAHQLGCLAPDQGIRQQRVLEYRFRTYASQR